MRWIARLLTLGMAVMLGLSWYAASSIFLYTQKSAETPADAAIVLGAAAWGNRPSPVFRARIDHAIRLYEQGQVDTLILTGGVGSRSSLSEAEVARRYAGARGVPDDAMLIEERSTSTLENLRNAEIVAEQNGIETVLITSNPFHMRRAMHMAQSVGLDAAPSPTQTTVWRSDASRNFQYFREFLAYMYFLVVG